MVLHLVVEYDTWANALWPANWVNKLWQWMLTADVLFCYFLAGSQEGSFATHPVNFWNFDQDIIPIRNLKKKTVDVGNLTKTEKARNSM